MKFCFSATLMACLAITSSTTANAQVQDGNFVQDTVFVGAANALTIVIGEDSNTVPAKVGWTDGVCYDPIASGVHPGDKLRFEYEAHNVYQMASKEHFLTCNFTEASLLSQVGESPFDYEIGAEAAGEILYFACQVGAHCASGTQKVQVAVTAFHGNAVAERPTVTSSYTLGTSTDDCNQIQESGAAVSLNSQAEANLLRSECSEPEPVEGQPNTFYRSCLSGPATLTPGGVVNRLFLMAYPFPQDRRVAIGQRIFEFVYDNPNGDGSVIPAPINQLYVHHMSGAVVFGQGAEGVRQTEPDAPFSPPYSRLSGDEGNSMVFHLIDLREVDDWLGCIECRCPVSAPNTYFDALTQTGNITGGVNCCSNCTSLTEPKLDYRMRYNVTYTEITPDSAPISDVQQLTSDISTAVGKFLEHDVPSSEYLPKDQQAPENPAVQRLIKEGPFNELFQEEFFARPYSGPNQVQLLRCVAHLHVASIEMYLEDTVTGERLCDGQTTYGTDPSTNAGFLTAVSVNDYDPPKTFPADRVVRFVTDYNATQLHTGVMGYWFLFVAGSNQVTSADVNMTANVCLQATCDANMLPKIDLTPFKPALEVPSEAVTKIEGRQADAGGCVDTLAESPSCTFGGLCDCETFVNAEESTGCDGFYSSPMGDIEVRSVCANFCGCDVSEAVASATSGTEEDCADTLQDNPACTFGGLCDCEAFVNAPEAADGCDGVYASPMGDIEVKSVCAKFCGCSGSDSSEASPADTAAPVPASAPLLGCRDTLSEGPVCRFAGICECEVFVDEPESEGCGGAYRSEMGDVMINEVCASYCGACEDISMDELFQETYMEVMTDDMRSVCRYADQECQEMLSNLYSCAEGMPGIEAADPMIQAAVVNMGQQVAMETSKVGHSSLHSGEVEQIVGTCPVDAPGAVAVELEKEDYGTEDSTAASSAVKIGHFAAVAAAVWLLVTLQ